jgi:transposase
MKKTKDGRRRFSRSFKIAAVKRVQRGERQAAVARDLGIAIPLLARWRERVRIGGESALKEIGRPMEAMQRTGGRDELRVAEMERLVGRQQAAIDFLKRALRRVEELRQAKRGAGAKASSK